MSEKESPQAPFLVENNRALSQLAMALRSQTNAIRLIEAKVVADAKLTGEIQSALSSLRSSSETDAKQLVGLVELLIEQVGMQRGDVQRAIDLLYKHQDRLADQRDRLSAMDARWTPTQVALPTPAQIAEQDAAHEAEPALVSKRGVFLTWETIKRAGPAVGWLSGIGTAAYHALKAYFGH